jgi:hypothetical protein
VVKKTVGIASLALLIALAWTYGISAESWDFIYEGDKIPDDPALGDDIWNVKGTSDICKTTRDGELHIIDPNDKTCHLLRDIQDGGKGTVEARVKVLSQSGLDYTILMGIEDAVGYAWLDLFPDRVKIHDGASHSVDMTDYHILRITRDGNDVTVYIDDEKVLEGSHRRRATGRMISSSAQVLLPEQVNTTGITLRIQRLELSHRKNSRISHQR